MNRGLAVLAVGVLLWGGGAIAADAPGDVTPPKWLHRPDWDDLFQLWPTKALERGTGGKATLHCKVSTAGALFDCSIVDEFPKGDGFGQAALGLTKQFQLVPAKRNGVPVVFDGVTLPLEWSKPQAATGSHRSGTGYFREKGRMVLDSPVWMATPSFADMAAAYPEKARAGGVAGRTLLHCQFDESSHLTACDTVFEEPKGMGFGSAALKLTKGFVGPKTLPDGRPIQLGDVQLPFAFATDLLEPEPLLRRPDWARLPEATDVASAFPARARAAGVTVGRATLGCVVIAGGELGDCKVEAEDPPGLGFGDAAMALRPAFRVTTWTQDGRPAIGSRVRVPLRYEDEAAAAAPAKP